jgi:hypothetical protein
MNDWNDDANCVLTSLLVWDLENYKCLICVAQTVHCNKVTYMELITVMLRSLDL